MWWAFEGERKQGIGGVWGHERLARFDFRFPFPSNQRGTKVWMMSCQLKLGTTSLFAIYTFQSKLLDSHTSPVRSQYLNSKARVSIGWISSHGCLEAPSILAHPAHRNAHAWRMRPQCPWLPKLFLQKLGRGSCCNERPARDSTLQRNNFEFSLLSLFQKKNEYSALQFRPLRFSMNVLYFHWIKIDHSTTKEYKFFFQMKLIAFYNLLETVSRGIPWQLTLPRSKIFPDF